VNAFTKPGDKIIIQPPVYHPFRMIIEENGRQLVNNQLKLVDGKYRMDFEHLRTVIDKDCKMLILCNPHNPGGIVWDRETLEELAEICADNDILVISDEIHADLVYEGSRHIPFATVSEKALLNSITFMAPSKTFNIAGIVSSYTITIGEHIRKKLHSYLDANSMGHGTLFSYIASTAAYKNGKDWLKELMLYLDGNVKFIDEYLKKNIPQIKAYIPEASFLVWLDCRELKLSQKELTSLFVDKARLALNEGVTFGPGGEGFMRLNIGTSREVLEKAMAQLKEAVL
jgi:cystathionine beta-lyase